MGLAGILPAKSDVKDQAGRLVAAQERRLCPGVLTTTPRGGRNDDPRSTSTRRAAVKNRLGRNLIRRKLRLQMRAIIVETGDDDENDRGAEH